MRREIKRMEFKKNTDGTVTFCEIDTRERILDKDGLTGLVVTLEGQLVRINQDKKRIQEVEIEIKVRLAEAKQLLADMEGSA